jgi:hypothetical protein
MLHDGAGGDEADMNPDLPNDLTEMSAALFALRGPEASAYRALAGEYLMLAVEVELTLDVVLSMWFIEMDRELFSEFDAILQRVGFERKLQTVKRLIRNESAGAGAGAVLARIDRLLRLRNRIAHQSPRIDNGVVHFNDGSLTAEQFEAEIKNARELPLELLDTLFPQVIERRRRWGARDVDDMDGLIPHDSEDDLPRGMESAGESDADEVTAKRSRRRRAVRRRPAGTGRESTSADLTDE